MTRAELSPSTKAFLVLPVSLLAGVLIVIAAQLLFARLLAMPEIAASEPAILEGGFILLCFGALALAAVIGTGIFGGRLSFGPRPGLGAAAGAGLGLLGLVTAAALSAVAGGLGPGAADSAGMLLLLGAVLALVEAGAEELYFRGWVQPLLQAGWGRWPGLIATALAFAAMHFVAGGFDPVSALNLFLGGLWFGLLADRSGGLALPIGAHYGWNAAEQLLFGLMPNPGASSFGALIDWELVGSPVWGGSELGLNASLSATFALVALIALTFAWRGRLSSPGRPG